jgi:hypothetical protein
MFDHVIVLNENHLRRLMQDHIRYYHEDRIHDALNKEAPRGRLIERREAHDDTVTGMPRVGRSPSSLCVAGGRLRQRDAHGVDFHFVLSCSGLRICALERFGTPCGEASVQGQITLLQRKTPTGCN